MLPLALSLGKKRGFYLFSQRTLWNVCVDFKWLFAAWVIDTFRKRRRFYDMPLIAGARCEFDTRCEMCLILQRHFAGTNTCFLPSVSWIMQMAAYLFSTQHLITGVISWQWCCHCHHCSAEKQNVIGCWAWVWFLCAEVSGPFRQNSFFLVE